MNLKMKKWDYDKRGYVPYEIPKDWHCIPLTLSMSEKINCVSCGKIVEYGDTYTSLQIHTANGMGYPVCLDCYVEEWKARFRAEKLSGDTGMTKMRIKEVIDNLAKVVNEENADETQPT